MAHCAEAYTSRKAHPLIDLYAIEGIRLVGRFLRPRGARRQRPRGARRAGARLALWRVLPGAGEHHGRARRRLSARHPPPHPARPRLRADFPARAGLQRAGRAGEDRAVLEALGLRRGRRRGRIARRATAFCAALGIDMRLSAPWRAGGRPRRHGDRGARDPPPAGQQPARHQPATKSWRCTAPPSEETAHDRPAHHRRVLRRRSPRSPPTSRRTTPPSSPIAAACSSEGCDGVALLGTTGEANSFSASERKALLEATVAAGIAPERLLPGTGVAALDARRSS